MRKQRNIIWIFGDQHRGQDLGCTGNRFLSTPNIDSLAPSGNMAVAGSPLCTPFRSALLTGQYPHKGAAGHDMALPDGSQMVSDAFREHGFHTAYFGKWHVDGAQYRAAGSSPAQQTVARERRGRFDTWLGYEINNAQYDCWIHGHRDNGAEVKHYLLDGYETDKLTDLLLEYLGDRAEDKQTPFFATLSVQPPHPPYVAPEEYTQKFKAEEIPLRPNVPQIGRVLTKTRPDLAGYYAMIENLDWNVGRVNAALAGLGLAENTVVVFFSDHGDMHGSHGQILKCSPYEESLRIPFLVGGAVTQTDEVRNSLPEIVNHVDIAPTSLGICDIDTPNSMEGTDYSGYFMTDREKPSQEPNSAYLQLVDPGYEWGFAEDRERPWRGIVTADGWKYAVLENQPWMMFNLKEDPYEQANMALDRRYNEKRKELQSQLAEWIRRTRDDFALPIID